MSLCSSLETVKIGGAKIKRAKFLQMELHSLLRKNRASEPHQNTLILQPLLSCPLRNTSVRREMILYHPCFQHNLNNLQKVSTKATPFRFQSYGYKMRYIQLLLDHFFRLEVVGREKRKEI